MKRFSTRSPLLLLLLSATLLSGCSLFGPPFPETSKFKTSKVENPFFSVPAENLKDYQDRTWILLAESRTKNWLYDPYSIFEDEDGIVSFDAFLVERAYQDQLQPFNATSVGPFRQKIDCFGNYQWSEIFYTEGMPKQETYINPANPNQEWGWIKIRPKTSMAYIRSRICGRKFIDDKNVNYFLFQQGKMPYIREKVVPPKPNPLAKDPDLSGPWIAQYRVEQPPTDPSVVEVPKKPGPNTPIFFDVVNNEALVIDAKKDVRQMKLISYNMDRDFSKRDDFVFQANCQARTYSLSGAGKSGKMESLSDAKNDFANVAFNRACGDHGAYMRIVGNGSKSK